MGATREWIIAHPEAELNEDQHARFDKMIAQMSRGMPLPYVLGEWEFFGLAFKVNHRRPYSPPRDGTLDRNSHSKLQTSNPVFKFATLERAVGLLRSHWQRNLNDTEIFATDISEDALKVAKENAQRHGVADRIKFIHGDLLEGVGKVNMICANLPYIPTQELETLEVIKHEPRLALDGGDDGLRIIERLLDTARDHLLPHGVILAEIAANEGKRR